MASTNQTPNYGLSQFESTDKLERGDYNADMMKIETHELCGSLRNSAAQNITHNTPTILKYNTVIDDDIRWTSGGEIQGFLIPAGYHKMDVSVMCLLEDVNTTGIRELQIIRSRSGTPLMMMLGENFPRNGYTALRASTQMTVEEGDFVYFQVSQTSTTTLNIFASNIYNRASFCLR